ncbi:hypothetical protein ACTGVU_10500, partial [Streptococcus suis]
DKRAAVLDACKHCGNVEFARLGPAGGADRSTACRESGRMKREVNGISRLGGEAHASDNFPPLFMLFSQAGRHGLRR